MSRNIIARAALPAPRVGEVKADIVLVHLDHNSVTPYVTWQMNLDDESCYWGHYHKTLSEAAAEFQGRCAEKKAIQYSCYVSGKRPEFTR